MELLSDVWFWICIAVALLVFGGLYVYQEFFMNRESTQQYATDSDVAPLRTQKRKASKPDSQQYLLIKQSSTPRQQPSIQYQEQAVEHKPVVAPPVAAVNVVSKPIEVKPEIAVMDFQTMWGGLQKAVHVLLVGETDAGKSTAANAMVYGRSETDKICILDPHAKPKDWGGLPAIGIGLNYPVVGYALHTLLQEMTARYARRAVGDEDYPSITIFIDELPSIMKECSNAAATLGKLLREARKVNMRLVLLTQSTRVKTLDIEGEGDLLDNLRWLVLGDKAVEECKDAAILERPAVFIHRGKKFPVYTAGLLGLSECIINSDVLWNIDLSEDAILAYEATIAPKEKGAGFTEQHLKVAAALAENPDASVRALARVLYPESTGGGDYSAKAKLIKAQVEKVLAPVSEEC